MERPGVEPTGRKQEPVRETRNSHRPELLFISVGPSFGDIPVLVGECFENSRK